MIPSHLLPKNIKIHPSSQTATAANGLSIPIKGTVENLPLNIEGNKIKIPTALTTKTKAPYALLEAPEIIQNPKLIIKILNPELKIRSADTIETVNESLTEEIKRKYSDLFSETLSNTTLCPIVKHKIETGDHKPICQMGERVPIHLQEAVNKEIEKLLNQSIIRESNGPWRSRLVIVPKEGEKIRMCIDYRALNDITIKNAYPLPRIDDIQDLVAKAEIFSVIDATSGYYQIAVEEEDISKTAFAWKGKLYEFKRMLFGLCNAPATYQAMMNTILGDANWKYAVSLLMT